MQQSERSRLGGGQALLQLGGVLCLRGLGVSHRFVMTLWESPWLSREARGCAGSLCRVGADCCGQVPATVADGELESILSS